MHQWSGVCLRGLRVIIEWLGGPEDGQKFEAPEGTRLVTIALFAHEVGIEIDEHTAMFPVADIQDIPVERRADGRYIVRYPVEGK